MNGMSDECLASYVFPHTALVESNRLKRRERDNFFGMCLGAREEERHATYDDGRMRGDHKGLHSNSIEEASFQHDKCCLFTLGIKRTGCFDHPLPPHRHLAFSYPPSLATVITRTAVTLFFFRPSCPFRVPYPQLPPPAFPPLPHARTTIRASFFLPAIPHLLTLPSLHPPLPPPPPQHQSQSRAHTSSLRPQNRPMRAIRARASPRGKTMKARTSRFT